MAMSSFTGNVDDDSTPTQNKDADDVGFGIESECSPRLGFDYPTFGAESQAEADDDL